MCKAQKELQPLTEEQTLGLWNSCSAGVGSAQEGPRRPADVPAAAGDESMLLKEALSSQVPTSRPLVLKALE